MITKKYFVQTKGIKANKFNWRTQTTRETLKEALKDYNFYKSGCCKRIKCIITTTKEKVIRRKNY